MLIPCALTFLAISVSAVWILLVFLLFVSLVSSPHTHTHTHTHTHLYQSPHFKTVGFFLFVCLQVSYLSPYTDNCCKLKLSLCSEVHFHSINNSDVTNVTIVITVNRIHWHCNFNQLYFFCTLLPDVLKGTACFRVPGFTLLSL